jgi:hypothetical protein
MNSEEVCEWLSASEQTQQPVLKAWWARLKSDKAREGNSSDFLESALASVADMESSLVNLKKKEVGSNVDNIISFAVGGGLKQDDPSIVKLKSLTHGHRAFNSFTTDKVDNPVPISEALGELRATIQKKQGEAAGKFVINASGDTPKYFPRAALDSTDQLVDAASIEDVGRIDQHLTTLRMRLRTRLADRRWSVFTNYDDLGISSTEGWFRSLGFEDGASRVRFSIFR